MLLGRVEIITSAERLKLQSSEKLAGAAGLEPTWHPGTGTQTHVNHCKYTTYDVSHFELFAVKTNQNAIFQSGIVRSF